MADRFDELFGQSPDDRWNSVFGVQEPVEDFQKGKEPYRTGRTATELGERELKDPEFGKSVASQRQRDDRRQEREAAKAEAARQAEIARRRSLSVGEQMGEDVARVGDEIEAGVGRAGKRASDLGEGTEAGWNSALAMMRQGRAEFEIGMGRGTPELERQAEEEKARSQAEMEGAPEGGLSWFGQAVGQIGGSLYSGMKQAAEAGATGAAVGAAGGAVGGPAGAVAGAIGGAGVGFAAGFLADSYRVNGGHIMGDLREAGVDPETARTAGIVGGGVMAALDLVSFKVISAPVSGVMRRTLQREFSDVVRQSADGPAAAAAKEYFKQVGTETGTETLQEIVQTLSVDVAKTVDGEYDTIFNNPENRRALMEQVWETALVTATGMSVVGIPGAGIRGVQARGDQRRAAQAPPAADTLALDRGAPLVTPEDEASPLPTDLIQEGKGQTEIDLELEGEDNILRQFAMPKVGADVVVKRGPDGIPETGKVLGSFTVEDDAGAKQGIRVQMNDGSIYEELFDDIERGGQSITPVDDYLSERPDFGSPGGIAPSDPAISQIPAETSPGERSPDRDTLKAHIKGAESSGKVRAKNPRSTASGLYQFTKATWEGLGGNWNDRFDVNAQEQMMDRLLDQNEAALRKAGFSPTAGNLYLAHFLGSAGAVKALKNPDGRQSAEVEAANPFLEGWTNAQIAAWAARKMGSPVPNKRHVDIPFDQENDADTELTFPDVEFADTDSTRIESEGPSFTEKAEAIEAPIAPETAAELWSKVEAGTITKADIAASGLPEWVVDQAISARVGGEVTSLGDFQQFVASRVEAAPTAAPDGQARTEAAPTPELSKQDQLKAKMADKRAAAAAEQPDMFGGKTKTAAELDAERFAPSVIEQAEERGTTDDLSDVVDYVLRRAPQSQMPETEAAAREFRQAVGDPSLSNEEVRALAQELDRTLNPPKEGEWQAFAPESGTLGVPRAEMPQIKGEDRGAMVNFLNARGVAHEEQTVPASQLKPTQAEWSPHKAASWDRGNVKLEERAILASSDGHILDGHHQWIKAQERGEDLRIIRLDKPIRELLPLVREFPSARLSEGATAPLSRQDELKAKMEAKRRYPDDNDSRVGFVHGARLDGSVHLKSTKQAEAYAAGAEWAGRAEGETKAVTPDSAEKPASVREEGRTAATRGLTPSDNPYLRDDPKREEWLDGYLGRTPKAPAGPRVFVNEVGPDGKTEAERGQPLTKIEREAHNLRNKAEPFQHELVAWGKRFDDDYGFINPRLKSAERIVEKLEKEDYQSLDEIKDVARVGFKVEAKSLATDLGVSAKRTFGAENVTDKEWKMVDGDYFDRKLIVSKDGIKAEIQIVPDAIEEYRHKGKREGYEGEGAELYKEWRKLHRDGDPRAAEVLAKMEAGYANAVAGTSWESFFNELKSARGNSLRASASESERPILETSPGADPQRSAEFQTSAQPRPETEPSATSRSSTSKNESSAIDSDIGARAVADKQWGSNNRLVTRDRAEEIRKELRAALRSQVSSGIDPKLLALGTELAVFHIEAGARKFADFASAMIADLKLSNEQAKRLLRGWYNGARDMMEDAGAPVADMDGPDQVRSALARLEPNAESGILPVQEATDASTSEASRAREDDRDGDEGSGAGDAPRAEGQRDAGERSEEPSAVGAGELPAGDQRSDGRSGDVQPAADGAQRTVGDASERSGQRGDRAGGRVRAKRSGAGRNFLAAPGSLKRTGGWKATAERNLDIVELVNKLDAEGRPATAEEQALLAKFTGWGASEIRNGLFGNIGRNYQTNEREIRTHAYGKTEWNPLIERAQKVLKGEELEQALQSTQYAHYTSEEVIRSIWSGMERMGFAGGRVLEPGMGIAHFFTAAPQSVAEASHYTGIELDAFTAKIAKYLLPQENALHADYVKHNLPDGFFDVAIGNPPFADIKITDDPAYKKHRFSLHDYFFAKSIDKVRPGGLLVFVTSRYTMDKLNAKARAYIGERADLLGAVRLPQTAFKENAGTEVVTDVLFFQKRAPGQEAGGEPWQKTEQIKVGKEKLQINEYFKAHPEMVLGKHATTGSMYRSNEYTVEPYKTKSIESQFAEAVQKLPEGVYTEAPRKAAEAAKAKTFERDFAPSNTKEGGLYTKDGKLYIVDQGSGVDVDGFSNVSANDKLWLKSYTKLRDALKDAQKAQLQDSADWEAQLDTLRKVYKAHVKKHGPLLDFTSYDRTSTDKDGEETVTTYRRYKWDRLFALDVEGPLVQQLEKINDEGEIVEGAFLKGRTLNKPKRPKIETPSDALAVTLDEIGRVDLDYAAKLLDQSREDLIAALGDGIYEHPSDGWQTADDYLSGNVLEKLEQAQAAAETDPRFERNVAALIKVQPKPLTFDKITVRFGAGWIPPEVVREFVEKELGIQRADIEYEPATGSWSVNTKGAFSNRSNLSDFGTPDRSPIELVDSVLNNRTIKVTYTVNDGGSKKTITDDNATTAANEAAKKIADTFKAWLWKDSKRTQELVELYNRKFNNIAPRQFDGSHLTLPGFSALIKPHDHVKRAAWRQIQAGNTYLAHAVGAGKTFEMIIGAMEQKRLGLIKKPMFVVPNHMLNQFAREFLEAYPAANIMVADEKAFHTGNRRRFMAQAALNDPDAIIITHSSFGKLPVSQESKDSVLDEMIAELEQAKKDLGKDAPRHRRSAIEKQLEALKRSFGGKASDQGKDKTLTFEEMGVDFLYVDEAHEFRKLDFATNRSAKGIDSKGSQKALDLFIKTRWLEKQRAGRSLVMASGTPITNTLGELYTVMRFMDHRTMERDGLQSFDAWANMFGEVAAGYEQNAAGGYEIVERFSKFVNVPELMRRVRSFMDVLTSDQLGGLVQRPAIKGGVPENVVVPASTRLERYMKETLDTRLKASRAWKPSKDQPGNPDPVINIITDARLASIDMRFAQPGLTDDPGSKLAKMVDQIIAKHKEFAKLTYVDPKTGARDLNKGAVQIVFSAVGFGPEASKNRGFDVRDYIDKRLIAGGLKKREIAWMGDANSHSKREALQKDVRSGKVKVLIGSPKNMGTGLNVQRRLKVLHFLSPPWYPSDVTQPHGRIERQGNLNDEIELYWYATKGTYDSTAWGMVSRKQKFIEQAMSGDESIRIIEDISEASQFEMAAALAAGDDRVIKVAGLSGDIERLNRLRGAHADAQRELKSDKNRLEKIIPRHEAEIKELEKASEAAGDVAEFSFESADGTFDKQKDAGEAIIASVEKLVEESLAIPTRELGKLYGKHPVSIEPAGRVGGRFNIVVDVGGYVMEVLAGEETLAGMDPTGLLTRIVNKARSIPSALAFVRQQLKEERQKLAATEKRIGVPFEMEGELAEKIAEREQLQAELAAETKAAEQAPEGQVAEPTSPVYVADSEQEGASEPLRRDSGPLPVRRGGSVRALGIADDLRRERSTALVGREIGSPQELAEVAQVYRDPRHETLRAFFVKGGKVVHATGVSARMASSAPLLPKGLKQRFPEWLREQMKATGADGYYLLHNHPSGDPQPSGLDVQITRAAARDAPGFLGHVVINSGRYAVIDTKGDVDVRNLDIGEDGLLKPSRPHPLLGTTITNWQRLAEVGKAVQQDGYVTVLGTDARGRLRVIVDHPASDLERPSLTLLGALRRVRRMSGSDRLFLAGTNIDHPAVREAISKDVLTDAVDGGRSLTSKHGLHDRERPPESFAEGGARFVAEQGAGFAPASPEFGGESEKRYKEATKGVGTGPGLTERASGFWADLKAGFSRHWRELPNEPRFADVQQRLRKLEAAHDAAVERTLRHLRDMVAGLSKEEYDLFQRKAVLDDLMWESDREHDLPFGFTPESLREAIVNVDQIAKTKPKVGEAIRKRKLFNRRLADDMVEAGVLNEDQVRNPAYFRHMVLDYARAEMKAVRSGTGKIDTPYWARRKGSVLDINANLVEAEFDWMIKAQIDIAMAETIEWVKDSKLNIREQLRERAKADNKAKVDKIIATDPQAKKIDAKFRSNMARGFEDVKNEIGNLIVPKNLSAAADGLVSGSRDADIFPLLSWIMDNDKPGSMGAAMILTSVGRRKAWEQMLLGEQYVDPNDVGGLVKRYKPDGYAAWQPREGRHLFTAKTVSEHVLDMFVSKLADTPYPGVDKAELELALSKVRTSLMIGGERYTAVLPEELAATLEEYGDRKAEGMVAATFRTIQSNWKRWILINPRRWFKYNLNNQSGDLDAVIAGNPKSLLKVGAAARELYNVWREKAAPSASYTEALERGVFTSGLSVQEIPDIQKLSGFAMLERSKSRLRPDRLLMQAAANFWRAAQTSTNFREAVFRYAAYLDYKQRLDAGESQHKIGYGASVPKMVDAVTDPADRAALLARDLVGDYGAISTAGGWLRRYLIPFWSWTEINTKRYWRLTANGFRVSKARGIATGGLLGAGIAARTAVMLYIRMGIVYGAVQLWNHLLFDDEEDDLDEQQKHQLHLILGRDSDGQVVTLRFQGALSDVFETLGFNDAVMGIKNFQRGQGTIGDAIRDTVMAPVNRVGTSTTPLISVPVEQLLGKKLWPDMTKPRTIHDRGRHFFQTFSLDNEYDALVDNPSRGYGRSWTESIVYRRDPGEMSYNESRSTVYRWIENEKGQTSGDGFKSPRSQALRNYKMALRFGDQDAAIEALEEYAKFDGTKQGLKTSIRRAAPLGPLAKKDRQAFVDSLTDEQYSTLLDAQEFYESVYLGRDPALND